MRQYSYHWTVFLILASVFFIVSCSEEPINQTDVANPEELFSDVLVADSLTVSFAENSVSENASLFFDSSKDAALLIIETGSSWIAESDAEWLILSALSGSAGKTGILAGASPNEFMKRTGQITITSGENTQVISVEQAGAAIISLTIDEITFRMILVEGGTFTLGTGDIYGSGPAYDVTLSDYYICETEVTNGLWNAALGALPYDLLDDYAGHAEYEKPDHPLTAATWNEIIEDFLPALNALTNAAFRLPTEAEWEYAAMGGKYSKGTVYAGGEDLDKVAWYSLNSGNEKKKVKQKIPNELGLYDMSGNVSEWCSDWYTYYYNSEDSENPTGPETGEEKVIRGGDFSTAVQFDVGNCAVKYRSYLIPTCFNGCWGDTGHPDEPICFRCSNTGFRVVLPY